MKRGKLQHKKSAFTLVEMMMSAGAAAVVGMGIFAVINTAMILAAKNLSVNMTNNSMRGALDQIERSVQIAYATPTLIDTSGNTVASGSSAGISFDRLVGTPYVLTSPTSGLPSSTTQLTLTSSTTTAPPIPQPGDVVEIDGAASTIRPVVSTVSYTTSGGLNTITVNLVSSLGQTVQSYGSTQLAANLVRKTAFIVMPSGSMYELRYYPSFESVANLNDPTQYYLISNQVGTSASDITPFSIATLQGGTFVKLSLCMRTSTYDKRLGMNTYQASQINTLARVDSYICPKVNQ